MKLIRSVRRGKSFPRFFYAEGMSGGEGKAITFFFFFWWVYFVTTPLPPSKKKKLLVFSASYLCVTLPHPDGKVPFALIHSLITHSALNGGFKAL